jgi:hypothetical protein
MPKKTAVTTIEIVSTNTTEFMGYPIDLLKGLSGMGRALVDDDALFEALTAFTTANDGTAGSVFGPALLTKDATTIVQSTTVVSVPEDLGKPDVVAAPVAPDAAQGWDALELDDLIALAAEKGVTVPGRVKTHGKLVAALEAAGISAPSA